MPKSDNSGIESTFWNRPGEVGNSDMTGSFVHVAVVRDSLASGGTIIYMNGYACTPTSTVPATGTISPSSSSYPLKVGRHRLEADSVTDHAKDFDGWIDEFRMVKGEALWDDEFTPPTAPATGATSQLFVRDSVGHEYQLTKA